MFVQIIKWVVRFAPILGDLEVDVKKTIAVVEADTEKAQKLKDAINGLLAVLEEIAGALK